MADYIAAAARSYVRTALPKLPADQVDGQALRLANGFAWHVETTGADGSELPFWRRLFKGSAFQPDEPYDLTRSMGRFGAYLIQVSSQGLKVPEGYWFGRK